MSRPRICALGSSFAAGPCIEPIEDHAAGRSSRNYAHQLAELLDADLVDLTVSGATLLTVLSDSQATSGRTFEPQLSHLPADTDIVTITCGGNDVGYVGGLMQDSLTAYLTPERDVIWNKPQGYALDHRQLTARILAVLDRIRDIAPEARVFVVEYLAIIGDGTRPWIDIPLTADQIAYHDSVAKHLAHANREAVQERS